MQPGDSATFSHTTLSNLEPDSFGLWVYTVLLLSYLPVGGFIMRRRLKQVLSVIRHIVFFYLFKKYKCFVTFMIYIYNNIFYYNITNGNL